MTGYVQRLKGITFTGGSGPILSPDAMLNAGSVWLMTAPASPATR